MIKDKRVALYCRVSTDEQVKFGESIQDQQEFLTRWAEEHGGVVIDRFVDAGISGHIPYTKRPELMRLLDCVQRNAVDVIVFTKLDRWTRLNADYYAIQSILDAHKVSWVAATEDYETATSAGRFKVGIMLSVNQHEAERTSERIRFVFREKEQRGEIPGGHAPLGYTKRGCMYHIDPTTQPAVKAFFDEYLSSFSSKRAIDAAKQHGVIISYDRAYHIIQNHDYTGVHGRAVFESYITEEQFELIQRNRKRCVRQAKDDRIYLFAGLVQCGCCGGRMHGNTAVRWNADRTRKWEYPRYFCFNPHCNRRGSVNADFLERVMLANVAGDLDHYSAEIKARQENTAPINPEPLRRKLERLKELYIDGDIVKADYVRRSSELKKEIDAAEAKPKQQAVPNLPEGWGDIYNSLSLQGRQAFWRQTVSRIIIHGRNPEHPEIFF